MTLKKYWKVAIRKILKSSNRQNEGEKRKALTSQMTNLSLTKKRISAFLFSTFLVKLELLIYLNVPDK